MLLKKSSFFIAITLLISVFTISRGETSKECPTGHEDSCVVQTSGISEKKYPFLDELVRGAETVISNGINKEKVLALTANEHGQIIDEVKSREIEILKNEMINNLKLGTIRSIIASSIAVWLRATWVCLVKGKTYDAGILFFAGAIVQAWQGAFCFSMIKMLRSEVGIDFVKVWTQERKRLFGMTMLSLILFAALDL
ncbi:MAG TPA: hypothetical protein ENI08_00345 [Candidatus Dependentiae bacterium]|nr:hypothetical protein [Candidatus Dependentiae bacterium]